MKRIMTIFKCACVLCVGNINMVFANNVDNQDMRKAAYELATFFAPRGVDERRWYGYDMKIEPAKENFGEGVVRGVVNTPANVIKKSDRYKPIKPTPKKKFALTWNYGEMGDNSGENKAGAFVGQIIGCALILFLIWLAFIKNRKNKKVGYFLLFIICFGPIGYKCTMRIHDTYHKNQFIGDFNKHKKQSLRYPVNNKFNEVQSKKSRIVLQAEQESLVQIKDATGAVIMADNLMSGDVFFVPLGDNLSGNFSNPYGIDVWVDGVLVNRIGGFNTLREESYLNPDVLKNNAELDTFILNNITLESITPDVETINRFKRLLLDMTAEQKLNMKQKSYWFTKTLYIYNYVHSIEYFINWCSVYHPVDNLRTEFDKYFGSVKEMVERTLVQFLGNTGAIEVKKIFEEDKTMCNFMEQQQEKYYQKEIERMRLVYKQTVNSKELYCKIYNSIAKDVASESYTRFLKAVSSRFGEY